MVRYIVASDLSTGNKGITVYELDDKYAYQIYEGQAKLQLGINNYMYFLS